ncbi:MAG: DUF512 domain-containing protein [Candidatus Marsarchaeota archaeon]|nr:DUF512 domain-containing protein [Candidatus Marsarchaeota archaeon]
MKGKALITTIEPDSLADALGLQPGDCLVAINGHPVRDILDYQFHASDDHLKLLTERNGEEIIYEAETDEGEPLGIGFEETTFDGVRRCRNKCVFCFVDRTPSGLRSSLYIKDDDYRYSFSFGSFITLTNLSEADWNRLAEQRLNPLYISVHTTDPDLRCRILGNPKAPDVLKQIERLSHSRIQLHTQIVLCPKLNDGEELSRTVKDLAKLYPTVQSIAIVPVGLAGASMVQGETPVRPYRPSEAQEVVEQVSVWQKAFRKSLGLSLVYLADEFYLLSETPLPARTRYDGFPQLENGLGLTRLLLDDWRRAKRKLPHNLAKPLRLSLVCGSLIFPLMKSLVDEMGSVVNLDPDLVMVENRFFGSNVTVSGLLTAEDIWHALRDRPSPDLLVLPQAALDSEGERFLDDVTLEEFRREVGIETVVATRLSQLVDLICQRSGC